MQKLNEIIWWFGSVMHRTLDLQSQGLGFDSRTGRCQVATTWIGDCLQTGKPSRCITNTKVNSAFHLFGVGKSSTVPACLAEIKTGNFRLCQEASNTV